MADARIYADLKADHDRHRELLAQIAQFLAARGLGSLTNAGIQNDNAQVAAPRAPAG